MDLSNESFVIAWQQAASVVEVARKLKLDTHTASNKAAFFRQRGVPLKKMPRDVRNGRSPELSLGQRMKLRDLAIRHEPDEL